MKTLIAILISMPFCIYGQITLDSLLSANSDVSASMALKNSRMFLDSAFDGSEDQWEQSAMEALELLNFGLAKTEDDSMKSDLLFELAQYNYLVDSTKVMDSIYQILSDQTNNLKVRGQSCIELGRFHYFEGSYAKSFEYYDRALWAFNKLGITDRILDVKVNMANLFFEINNVDLAKKYYSQVLELAVQQPDSVKLLFLGLSNQFDSDVEIKRGNYNLALEYANKAETEFSRYHSKKNNGDSEYYLLLSYLTKAAIYNLQGNFDKANEYLEIVERSKLDEDKISTAHYERSQYYIGKNDINKAIQELSKSIEAAENAGSIKDMIVSLDIHQTYHTLDSITLAYEFLERKLEFLETNLTNVSGFQNALISSRDEIILVQERLVQAKEQIILQRERLLILVLSSIFILTILVLWLLSVMRSLRKLKKKLKEA